MRVESNQASHPASGTLSNLQLNRALMERQFLLQRTRRTVFEVIEHLVGMQAQIPGSPYAGLWSRLQNFHPEQLSELLVSRRAVRTVLMRSTLHLVSDRDLLALWPLTRTVTERQFKTTEFARDLVGLDLDAIAAAADAILKAGPRTQAALGDALAPFWPGRRAQSLAYAIRSAIPLVQIPPRGLWGRSGQATWARAEDWLGRPIPETPSLKALFLRYLAAFGPATISDFQSWSGLAGVHDQIEGLRPQLRVFRNERGRELFDLPENTLPDPDLPVPVRFLPEYDNVLLAHADRSRVIPEKFRTRIGIGQPTILVDGFVRGTWKLAQQGASAMLTVALFEALARKDSVALRKEAREFLAWMQDGAAESRIEIIYAS